MKPVFRPALAICFVLVMSLISCKDKDDGVTFDVTLEHTFNISVNYADVDVTYQTQELLDAAAASDDLAKYKDRIKSITVTGATYVIENCTTPAVVVTNATLAYSSIIVTTPDGTSATVNLDIQNAKAAEGRETTVPFSPVATNDMSNLLKTHKEINLYFNGILSETPAKFDLVLKLKVTVNADKL